MRIHLFHTANRRPFLQLYSRKFSYRFHISSKMTEHGLLLMILYLLHAVNSAQGHGSASSAEGHGKEFDVGGVFCKALEESGKIMCARPPEGKKRDFSDENNYRVIIEFDSLQERSKSGISVGKVGRKGHMFDQFSEQEFNFTDPSAGTYQGLVVKNFNFSSSLPGPNASLTVMAYMFKESGNITFGNETTEMRKGMLKFNIQIENWKFCTNNSLEDCNSGDEGEFIDVSLVIESKGKPKPFTKEEVEKGRVKMGKNRGPRCFKPKQYNKCPKEFDIGGGSEMVLSSQVMVDNVIQEMPGNGDYPKFMEQQHKQKFIFRFPRAMNRILYDPGLEVGEENSSTVHIRAAQSITFLMVINCFAFFSSF
ncbi:skeletal aspartic acid-rich protein 1-like [Orbicella faveolata]|uniref:skeletal aspartic acid-rich protein 1-like n=1 Tax=Orbicella faveolata TaxID=48498 RepID=UPI0009E63A77|nr:skeletal aspartic acid-rich protein 1-like [Orbicella faveolata]